MPVVFVEQFFNPFGGLLGERFAGSGLRNGIEESGDGGFEFVNHFVCYPVSGQLGDVFVGCGQDVGACS